MYSTPSARGATTSRAVSLILRTSPLFRRSSSETEPSLAISASPSLEPGQQATVVFVLEKDVKSGRDLQFKLQTAAGAVFVSTINSAQQSG